MKFADQMFYTEGNLALSEKISAKHAPKRVHQEIVQFLSKTIGSYIDSKGGSCRVYPAPFAVKLSDASDTTVEPDISVICDPGKLTDKGCTGAPDWIIEVASQSSSRHDFCDKRNLYQASGVREYWIVDPSKNTVDIHILKNGKYLSKKMDFDQKIKVEIYENLYIDFKKITAAINRSFT